MSKTLFKRAAATGAAFIAIGAAGVMSLPAVAGAATTQPTVSQSTHAVQAHQHPMLQCSNGYPVRCRPDPHGPYPK